MRAARSSRCRRVKWRNEDRHPRAVLRGGREPLLGPVLRLQGQGEQQSRGDLAHDPHRPVAVRLRAADGFVLLRVDSRREAPVGRRFRQKSRTEVRLFFVRADRQTQYTKMKSPSHTTSTKCQYQDTASNPKWWSGLKWPATQRKRITVSIVTPSVTWNPWKPVSMKKVDPKTPVVSLRLSSS